MVNTNKDIAGCHAEYDGSGPKKSKATVDHIVARFSMRLALGMCGAALAL